MTIPCLSFQKLKPINLRGFTYGFQSTWFQVVPFFVAIVAAKNFKSCREIENLCLCLQKRFPKYEVNVSALNSYCRYHRVTTESVDFSALVNFEPFVSTLNLFCQY